VDVTDGCDSVSCQVVSSTVYIVVIATRPPNFFVEIFTVLSIFVFIAMKNQKTDKLRGVRACGSLFYSGDIKSK